MKILTFVRLGFVIIAVLISPIQALGAPSSPIPAEHGGIVPDCNPALSPNFPYSENEKDPEKIPCGLNKFVELIQSIIKFLSLIVIPIAVLMIGWGGFQILTSAGSEEKLGAGKKAIITAATGIVIILVSYIVVKLVFDGLGVTAEFRGSLFK